MYDLFKMAFRTQFKTIHFKITFVVLLFIAFLYNVNFLNYLNIFSGVSQKHLIACYFHDKHSNSLLELDPQEVTKNSIFFVETSCNHIHGINLNLRQSCAIESAAKLNPNLQIFVLFVAPSFLNNKSDVINVLYTYKNVNFRYINFAKYAYKTPLQDFVASNRIFTSRWPVSHTSDLLRFLTLWKYGGTYLDLDVVLMKSLEGITNFASIESTASVASFVLNFDTDNVGTNVANIAVSDFAENYRGDDWGYNGPGVITRTLQKICNTDALFNMIDNKEKCKGLMVFGPETFCPISWMEWQLYFDANKSEEVMMKIKDSIGIHVWNLHSKHKNIIVGSKQPYSLVAQEYCPNIYSLAKYTF